MLTTRRPHIAAVKLDINWHPGLSIYASEKFLKAVSDEYGWVGGADDQGELRCVLPYTVIRKAGCQMIRFRTETLPVLAELDQVEERAFLDGVIEYFRETGADMIIVGKMERYFGLTRRTPWQPRTEPFSRLLIRRQMLFSRRCTPIAGTTSVRRQKAASRSSAACSTSMRPYIDKGDAEAVRRRTDCRR